MPTRSAPCPSCGQPVPSGRLACPSCGTLIAAAAASILTPNEPAPAVPTDDNESTISTDVDEAALEDVAAASDGTAKPAEDAVAVASTARRDDADAALERQMRAPVADADRPPAPAPEDPVEAAATWTSDLRAGAYLPPAPPAATPFYVPAPRYGATRAPAPEARPYDDVEDGDLEDADARSPVAAAVAVAPAVAASVAPVAPPDVEEIAPSAHRSVPAWAPPVTPSASAPAVKETSSLHPGRSSLFADLPFDPPDDLAGWLVAIGSVASALSFLLPWAPRVLGASDFGTTYFGQWGLGAPAHLAPFFLILALVVLAVLPNRVPTWLRTGMLPILAGGFLLGLTWPYLVGGFGARIGVTIEAVAAFLFLAGGFVELMPRRSRTDAVGEA